MWIIAYEYDSVLEHHQCENIDEAVNIKHVQNREYPFLDEICFGLVPICQERYFLQIY